MKKKSFSVPFCLAAVAVVVIILSTEASTSQAVTCNPMELSPCLAAVTSLSPPTADCCSKLKEQLQCLCGYLKIPDLKPYISGAKKIFGPCGVPLPSC